MHAPGDDRFFTELRGCTAELARIIDGDLERPVPTCPGWTFRQLATHVGRGHRWAAQIVSTRATMPIPTREVAEQELPQDPAQHAPWLNAGAERVVEAVTAAGSDLVWTLAGIGPASFWGAPPGPRSGRPPGGRSARGGTGRRSGPRGRRRRHRRVAWTRRRQHRGHPDPGRAQDRTCAETARACIFHATDPGLSDTGEWLVTRTPSGVTVTRGHGKADVAVRGPAARQLLVLTRRLPPSDPAIEVLGEQPLLTHWLQHTPF